MTVRKTIINTIDTPTKDQCFIAAIGMREGTHGSFAKAIGDAWVFADSSNRERLKKAFGDLLARVYNYENMQ